MNKRKKMTLTGLLIVGVLLIGVGAGWSVMEWQDVSIVDVENHPEAAGMQKIEATLELDPEVKSVKYDENAYRSFRVTPNAQLGENEVRVSGYYDPERYSRVALVVLAGNVLSLNAEDKSGSGIVDLKRLTALLKEKKIPSSFEDVHIKVELNPIRFAEYKAALEVQQRTQAASEHQTLNGPEQAAERETFTSGNGEKLVRITHADGSVTYEKAEQVDAEASPQEDAAH